MPNDISPITSTEVKKIQCGHCGSIHRAERSGVHYTDYFDCPSCSGSFAWTWGETGESHTTAQTVGSTFNESWKKGCKACGFQFAGNMDLCPCCGMYRSRVKSNDFEGRWEALMAQPLSRLQHEEFILSCLASGQLIWVRRKYEEVHKLTELEFFGGLLQFVRDHAPVPRIARRPWNTAEFIENLSEELKTFFLGVGRKATLLWRSLDRVHQGSSKD